MAVRDITTLFTNVNVFEGGGRFHRLDLEALLEVSFDPPRRAA